MRGDFRQRLRSFTAQLHDASPFPVPVVAFLHPTARGLQQRLDGYCAGRLRASTGNRVRAHQAPPWIVIGPAHRDGPPNPLSGALAISLPLDAGGHGIPPARRERLADTLDEERHFVADLTD